MCLDVNLAIVNADIMACTGEPIASKHLQFRKNKSVYFFTEYLNVTSVVIGLSYNENKHNFMYFLVV